MNRKLKKDRIIILGILLCIFISLFFYIYQHMNHIHEYPNNIKTFTGCFSYQEKIYTFDVKSFVYEDNVYLSLNDMYNVIFILEPDSTVYRNTKNNELTYIIKNKKLCFDYGHGIIINNQEQINLRNENMDIFLNKKNVYIPKQYVEKLLLKGKYKVIFKEKYMYLQ